MDKPTIKKWEKAGCVFCDVNPSVEAKSEYFLEDNVRIKGLGTGSVVGGICKRHFGAIGEKYLSTLNLKDHEARIKRLERVFKGVDEWLRVYKRDKKPMKSYPPEIWKAVRQQAIVILEDLKKRGEEE